MGSARVYIGHLPSRATDRDVEDFFRGFGKIRDVIMKNGFGFVEFYDYRDAVDAVDELNGRDLLGERVVVELSRRDRERDRRDDRSRRDDRGSGNARRDRYGPPVQTRYRLTVENLSTRCSWQDLKDLMRGAGDVTYADAHKKVPNTAVVCFGSRSDLKRALDKYQGKEINGRRIKLIDESEDGSSKSPSQSRSRSRSRSPRPESRSRSPRSRTRSPEASPGKPSHSRSQTPDEN